METTNGKTLTGRSMKIMNKEEPWSGKVNFIDENEVHLGYDTNDD